MNCEQMQNETVALAFNALNCARAFDSHTFLILLFRHKK